MELRIAYEKAELDVNLNKTKWKIIGNNDRMKMENH